MREIGKGHVALVALSLLAGLAVASMVSATEYEEVATVAEGVYFVSGEDNRFKIAAEDAASVLVYGMGGDILLQKDMDAGEERDFVLSDGKAVVALFGGEAAIESAGDAKVSQLGVEHDKVALASGSGEDVREHLTIQLPRMLVGVGGYLDGSAEALSITVTTEEGTVLEANAAELSQLSRNLAVEALGDGAVDIFVNATALDGELYAVFAQPRLDALKEIEHETHSAHAETETNAEDERPEIEAVPIDELTYTPLGFELTEDASLVFQLEDGHLLDVSIYDDDGDQVAYIHRGPSMSEARDRHCEFEPGCWWSGYDHNDSGELENETIEVELAAGEYVLFVRAAAVDGLLTVDGTDPVAVFASAEELEVHSVTVHAGEEVETAGPVLDLHADRWDSDAFQSMELTLDGETVYTYDAMAKGPGGELGADEEFHFDLLGTGTAVLDVDSLRSSFGYSQASVHLLVLGEHPEHESDEDDEDDEDGFTV